VVEPDRQQPLTGHALDTTVATAGPQVLVQVADRLAEAGVVGLQDRSAGGRVTQADRTETLLVGRRTTSKAGTALRP
jgi:hypothetical protein